MATADQLGHFRRYSSAAGWEAEDTHVIAETSVDLSVNGEPWLSFACTPQALDALAVGFLYNEGFIRRREEIVTVDICAQETLVDVWLQHALARPTSWRRTSGCTGGFTSGSSPTPGDVGAPNEAESSPAGTMTRVAPEILMACMEQLLKSQELYREAGGVHTSAISDGQAIRVQAEDIGRHNTLDKLAGLLLLKDITLTSPVILITTGRISSEMLQKAGRIGADVIMSRTSPTSQSVALAEQAGITLVGYARRNGFMVYAHPERLQA